MRLISLSLLLGMSVSAYAAPVTYKLNTEKSTIDWKATKVVGGHNGFVKLNNGEVSLDAGKPTAGKFEINFLSITDLDIKDAENRGKLEGHLKSADFFDATGKHPTGSFVLKSASPMKQGNNFNIVGDLTVKGITKQINFPAEVKVAGKEATAKGTFKINRLDYDIKYNSAKVFDVKKLGDKAIHDDIELTLNLVAEEAAPAAAASKAAPAKATKAEATKKSTPAKK